MNLDYVKQYFIQSSKPYSETAMWSVRLNQQVIVLCCYKICYLFDCKTSDLIIAGHIQSFEDDLIITNSKENHV